VLIPVVPRSEPSAFHRWATLLFKIQTKIFLFETKREISVFPPFLTHFPLSRPKANTPEYVFSDAGSESHPLSGILRETSHKELLPTWKVRRKSDCLGSGVRCVSRRKTQPSPKRDPINLWVSLPRPQLGCVLWKYRFVWGESRDYCVCVTRGGHGARTRSGAKSTRGRARLLFKLKLIIS